MFNKIFVTGSISFDQIMKFEGLFEQHLDPHRLDNINVSFNVEYLRRELGGNGFNIIHNLNLIQAKNFKIFGAVGKDGDGFLNELRAKQVDVSGIVKLDDIYSAAGNVITDSSEDQIWGFCYGACEYDISQMVCKEAQEGDLLLITPNYEKVFVEIFKKAIKYNIDFVLDPGMVISRISKEDLREGILNCKYLVSNDYEIAQLLDLAGVTAQEFIQSGKVLITTLGSKGVLYQDKENEYKVPAFRNKKTVDPTGAGDAWRAGFFGSLQKGLVIKEALGYANALASFAVQKFGTVNHTPTFEEIKDRAEAILRSDI